MILSVRLNLVRKHLKRFLREGYSFWNDNGRRRLHLKLFHREGFSKNKMIPISIWSLSVVRANKDRCKIQNWNITPVLIPFSILMYRSCNVFFTANLIVLSHFFFFLIFLFLFVLHVQFFLNRLTAMVSYLRPLFFELRTSLITFRIFVRCQRLIARNVADGFLLFSLADTF